MATVPNNAKGEFLEGNVNWESDSLMVALVNDQIAYSMDIDTDSFVADVLDGTTAEEFGSSGGTGYSRQSVDAASVSVNNTDNRGEATGDDVTFTELDGETIQGVLVFEQRTDDTDSPILYYLDDADVGDLPKPTNGGDITIQWAAAGILNLNGA